MTHLLPPVERAARVALKLRTVLRFLRTEIFSSRQVLQELLGLSQDATLTTMAGYERQGLVLRGVVLKDGVLRHLYGITLDGQMAALDEGEDFIDRWFRPSSVGVSTLNHTLHLQMARVRAERAGWTNWRNASSLGKIIASDPFPDALVDDPSGECFAVEMELTTKSSARYEQILYARMVAVKARKFDCVVWIGYDATHAAALERRIKAITTINVLFNGQRKDISIIPEQHHSRLHFVEFEKWPSV